MGQRHTKAATWRRWKHKERNLQVWAQNREWRRGLPQDAGWHAFHELIDADLPFDEHQRNLGELASDRPPKSAKTLSIRKSERHHIRCNHLGPLFRHDTSPVHATFTTRAHPVSRRFSAQASRSKNWGCRRPLCRDNADEESTCAELGILVKYV